MQILKLCRFRKACKVNLIKFRETEIQRRIWNRVKLKIELLWKNKIALTLFVKYNFISDATTKDSQDALWSIIKFRRVFFLVNVSRMARWIFELFWLWINGKTIKIFAHFLDLFKTRCVFTNSICWSKQVKRERILLKVCCFF